MTAIKSIEVYTQLACHTFRVMDTDDKGMAMRKLRQERQLKREIEQGCRRQGRPAMQLDLITENFDH